MAVYKPNYCYPYLEPVDLTIPDGEKYFTCQIDTSNIAITGYKIEVYDENNTLVFPNESNKNKISPVSELPIVTNIDGLNGSELRIPFIQHFKPKITTSYNAIYFKATKYVDYYQSTPLVPGDGHSFAIGYNGQFCELIKTDPETGVRTLEPVVVDDSLIFVGDTILAPGANDTICIYTVTTEGLSEGVELTNNDIIYVKSGDTYSGSVFQYNGGALIQSTDGVWVDCNENPLSLSNQGKTYKWQITLYSGSKGAITESKIIDPQEPPLHTISYDAMADSEFDTLLTSGTILGSTEDRIQGPISDKIYAKQWLQLLREVPGNTWAKKEWANPENLRIDGIWTDGENVYYSYDDEQYQLDKSTSTWKPKIWNGKLTKFRGANIWTDGENIYYSDLDLTTNKPRNYKLIDDSKWEETSLDGLKDVLDKGQLYSEDIWTDGETVYYSHGADQYKLDKAASKWSTQSWGDGFTPGNGKYIWTDGENVYYSSDYNQYQLNKTTNPSWSKKTWYGVTTRFWGTDIWTDGKNIYYSYQTPDQTQQHQLVDKTNGTWSDKTWDGFSPAWGSCVWTDGTNVYYSHYANGENTQYQLLLEPSAQVGTRTYIESYSQSLGHIYPISGDSRGFSNDDLYGVNPATHFAVYKYSNDPEHITSQNSVDQSINFDLQQCGATYTQGNYSYEVTGKDDIDTFNNKCKALNTTPLCNYKHDEKQDSYTADYGGQSVLIWNEKDSSTNPLTGYFTINFTTSQGSDGKNIPKFTFLMAYAYRKISSYIGKVFFVKDGSFMNQNIVSKAEATGDNDILSLSKPITFIEEEPLEIYPDATDKLHGEIFKNSAGKVYVSPFVGLQAGARLYVSGGTVIKATEVDTTNWAVTYIPDSPASKEPYPSINPLKYEIRTNFKSSDETPFYAYDSPRLVPWVLEHLAVANEHGHEFLLESGGEILTVPILCSQKVDRRYIEVGGQYLQAQNKSWTSYRWLLVDAYGNIIQDTGKQYDGAIRTTFYGLDGPTKKAVENHEAIPNVYYIVLIVEDELGNVLLMGIKIEVTIDPTELIAQFSGEFDCKTHSVKLGIQDYGYPALSKDENNQALKLGNSDGVVTSTEDASSYVGLQGVDKGENDAKTPSWKATSKMVLPLEGAQLKRFFKYQTDQLDNITQNPSKMVANKEGNIEFHTQVELDANFCGDIFTYVVDIGDRFGNTDKLRISLALPENFLTLQGGDKA
mgnify:CR=1 FL=1|jgi:hypothetical protein